MGKVSKTNKRIIVVFSLILITFFCVTSLSSVKADSGNNIAINYSAYQAGILLVQFGEYPNTPEASNDGFVFLVVNMTIHNDGYDIFNTGLGYFYVTANNTKFNFDSATYEVNNWATVDIPNGGTFVGTIVFQIPNGSIISNLGYNGYYNQSQSYNIIWTPITASPTPTPVPTPIPSLTSIPTYAFPEPTQKPTSTAVSGSSSTSFWLIANTISLIVIAVLLAAIIALLLTLRHRKTANLKQ